MTYRTRSSPGDDVKALLEEVFVKAVRMTIELTKEEVKGLLAAVNTHLSYMREARDPEAVETSRILKLLRVRLTAFDPDATQRIRAILAETNG